MPSQQRLRDLESRTFWCWHWYLLRVWRACGSFESATDFDRLQIAEELLMDCGDRDKEWSEMGRSHLLEHLVSKLDDPDLMVRQEAAIAIGDHCRTDHLAIDVLIERLRSPEQSFNDRACAAWALGRIKQKRPEIVPLLLTLIEEEQDQDDADEFRRYSAEAVERLTGDSDVLSAVARFCLDDPYWKCRMHGLFLVGRLTEKQPALRASFVSLVERLQRDEVEEIREYARRFVIDAGVDE